MANHKRKKTKRRVRCTLCTKYRWMGNNKGRKPSELSEHRDAQKMKRKIEKEIDDAQK